MATAAQAGSAWRFSRGERIFLALVLLLALVGILVSGFQRAATERFAVRELPPAERRETYERELASFRSLCSGDVGGELASHCEERARLLRAFPECDAACLGVVQAFESARRR